MNRVLVSAAISVVLAASPAVLHAQQEGPVPTQVLVRVDSKSGAIPTPTDISAQVNGKPTSVLSINPIPASNVQVALLIDDGLRREFGVQISDLKDWILQLRPGTQIFIGYMQNGRVVPAQNFTTDYAAAVSQLRIPLSLSTINGSPYFSVSDFVKQWPSGAEPSVPGQSVAGGPRNQPHSRFIIMLTNGVDRYNGSVSPLNQDSPYVTNAADDAQRAGVPVYSIYYGDRGMRGPLASFSGQSYLSQVAQATGGDVYTQGTMSPVSVLPFLKDFDKAVASTYIVTVDAVAHKRDTLVQLKLSTKEKGVKLHAPATIHPGDLESSSGQ